MVPFLIGRLNVNVVPLVSLPLLSTLLLAHILPPCFSMIFLQMYRADPVPHFEPVTKFVKTLSFIFGGVSGPLSIILTNTVLLSLSCLSRDTIISPSCTILFIALLIMSKKTWFKRNLSANNKIKTFISFKG